MIHVLLVDEQRLYSEAIHSIISKDDAIQPVEMMATYPEAITYIKDHRPDVVLISMHVPAIDGVKAARHIKTHYPKTKVVFFTTFIDKDLTVAALRVGIDGFLFRTIDEQGFIQAIRNAHKGEVVISGDAAKILAEKVIQMEYNKHEILNEKLVERKMYLTDRELDIALLMMDGKSNKQIANHLSLREGTTKNYISSIYDKVNLRNRDHVMAYLHGLFSEFYY